jgi:hypothetical protein
MKNQYATGWYWSVGHPLATWLFQITDCLSLVSGGHFGLVELPLSHVFVFFLKLRITTNSNSFIPSSLLVWFILGSFSYFVDHVG